MCKAFFCPNCHMSYEPVGSVERCGHYVVLTDQQKRARRYKCPAGPVTYLADFTTRHEPNLICSGDVAKGAAARWRVQVTTTNAIREATPHDQAQRTLIDSYTRPGALWNQLTRTTIKNIVGRSHTGMALEMASIGRNAANRLFFTDLLNPTATAGPGGDSDLAGDNQGTTGNQAIMPSEPGSENLDESRHSVAGEVSGPGTANNFQFFAYNGVDGTETPL